MLLSMPLGLLSHVVGVSGVASIFVFLTVYAAVVVGVGGVVVCVVAAVGVVVFADVIAMDDVVVVAVTIV